jgi:hypothetical protein
VKNGPVTREDPKEKDPLIRSRAPIISVVTVDSGREATEILDKGDIIQSIGVPEAKMLKFVKRGDWIVLNVRGHGVVMAGKVTHDGDPESASWCYAGTVSLDIQDDLMTPEELGPILEGNAAKGLFDIAARGRYGRFSLPDDAPRFVELIGHTSFMREDIVRALMKRLDAAIRVKETPEEKKQRIQSQFSHLKKKERNDQ